MCHGKQRADAEEVRARCRIVSEESHRPRVSFLRCAEVPEQRVRPNDRVMHRSDQPGIARPLRQTHAFEAIREQAPCVALTHLDGAVEVHEERQ
jgi:hypothetical protein